MFGLAIGVVGDDLQDVTRRRPPAAAFADHASEFSAQHLQLSDFALDGLEMTGGDHVCVAAVTLGVVDQIKKRPNFGDVEAQPSRMADEVKPLQMLSVVVAVISVCARRRRHQPNLLVEADGLHLRAGRSS